MLSILALLFSTTNSYAADKPPWPKLLLKKYPVMSLEKTQNDVALIISIEDYAFASDIPGANANGDAWKYWLQHGMKIPPDRIVHLKDKQARRSEIEAQVDILSDLTTDDSQVWFVFIGHGSRNKKGQGILLDVTIASEANSIASDGILYTSILSAFEKNNADVVAVLDSCFSGNDNQGKELATGLMSIIATESLEIKGQTTVFTAGGNDQYAGPLPGWKRPAFSYLMLGSLQGWGDENSNGKVTAGEALSFTKKTLRRTLRGRQQTPQGYGIKKEQSLSKGSRKDINITKIERWLEANPDKIIDVVKPKPTWDIDVPKISLTTIGLVASGVALNIAHGWEQTLQTQLTENQITLQQGKDRQLQTNILYGVGYTGLVLSGISSIQLVMGVTGNQISVQGTW